jgi:hypothetical protein
MTAEVFSEYTKHAFTPHLGKHFPVILFATGHSTILTYYLSELCCELSIILLSLYSNATSLFQPLDVTHFKQRMGWKTTVLGWQSQNSDKILHKEWFSPVLDSWVECCRNMFWKAQLHMVFQLVTCTHGIQKTMTSRNALEKLI